MANKDLKQFGMEIRVLNDPDDGTYACDINDGFEWASFADNYYERELGEVVNEAWEHARAKAKAKQPKKVWVVTYVGLSDSEYEANGYCECHVCGTLEAAKAKMLQLRDAEIENCKAEGRDYQILEDETTELRMSWCSHGEQVRLEIHEEEVK